MSDGFVHSVTVPRIYKITANIVRRVREDGDSLKTLIYERKHPNVSGIYGLSTNTLQALPQLDQLLHKTRILTEQPRLDPWLARVLLTELLWRKKCLKGCSKPILTILAYENKLREEFENLDYIETVNCHKEKVQKPRYVRVNTLLLSVEKAISMFQEEGWQLLTRSTTYSSYLQTLARLSEPYFIQDLHIPEVLAFPSSTFFHKHTGYQNGEIVLQDKASCLPVYLLNPVSGSIVLDMCAAPGMKTTHLAAKLQNYGKVYAVEIDSNRFETLFNLIEKTHSSCVETLNQDALTLDPKRYSDVEYILVDPSCSGSGIVDRPKQNNMDGKPQSERLQNLQSFQVYLLRYALLNFPNAKRIIYSTCSLYPEENEEVIDEVLADIGNAYCLVSGKQLLKNNWTNFSSEKYICGDRCLYSKPDIDFCNGFFVAIFERNFNIALPRCKRKGGNVNPNEVNVEMERDDTAKRLECKQKERKRNRKKRKKENKREALKPDEQMKIFEGTTKFVTPKAENQIKTEASGEKVGQISTYRLSTLDYKETALDHSEGIQKMSKNVKARQSGKKRKLKHENIIQMENDEETCGVHDCERKEQKKGIETESLKKKKKRKKDNKEIANKLNEERKK